MSRYAYVTNTDSNTLSVVDLCTNEELKQIEIGDSPRGAIGIDTMRGYGYVSNCAGDTISVIDLNEDLEINRIKVGLAPRGLIVDEKNMNVIVTAFDRTNITTLSGNDKMTIVSIDTLRRVGNLPTGLGACSVNIVDTDEIKRPLREKVPFNIDFGTRKIG